MLIPLFPLRTVIGSTFLTPRFRKTYSTKQGAEGMGYRTAISAGVRTDIHEEKGLLQGRDLTAHAGNFFIEHRMKP